MTALDQADKVIVGLVIRLNRIKKGLFRGPFAEEVGESRESIIDIEAGRELPSPECFQRMAECFGKSQDDLLAPIENLDLVLRLQALALSEDDEPLREFLVLLGDSDL